MRLGAASGEALRGRFVCVRKRKASSCQMAPPAENLRSRSTKHREKTAQSGVTSCAGCPPFHLFSATLFPPRLYLFYQSLFFFFTPHTVTSTGGHVGCRHVSLVTGGHKFVRPTVKGSKGKKKTLRVLGRGVEGGGRGGSVTLFLARAHGCL